MTHSGLFVDPVPGTPPVGMSAQDGRLALGGIYGTNGQLVSGTGYTTSSSALTITVHQSVWALPDVTNSSAVFLAPTDSTTVTFAAAPSTGGRIDLVCVKQNNYANGDADSRANVYVVAGTASASPVPPATPPGAFAALQVLINAGVTNSVAATITNNMTTNYNAPMLQATTLARLNSATGQVGQTGVVTTDSTATNNGVYMWNGSMWVPNSGACMPHFQYQRASAFTWPSTSTVMTWDGGVTDGVLAGFTTTTATFTCTIPGVYQLAGSITASSAAGVYSLDIHIYHNGSSVMNVWDVTNTTFNQSVAWTTSLRFAVGDTFQIFMSASTATPGYPSFGSSFLNVDFLHA